MAGAGHVERNWRFLMWSQQEVEVGTANLPLVLPIGRTKQEVSWQGAWEMWFTDLYPSTTEQIIEVWV